MTIKKRGYSYKKGGYVYPLPNARLGRGLVFDDKIAA